MKSDEAKTIEQLSKRSDHSVKLITIAFAMGGAIMDIVCSNLTDGATSGLWGFWIPFCFITIPPIHFLCRRIERLETRIEELSQV
ncbi:hypothetical protein OAE79_03020 [Rhodopirellula sp.]|nr:hypothetical protein [Rhodopirellula sp.]MDB4679291.1 hypothetical protein [Rhodopirellula sp.]